MIYKILNDLPIFGAIKKIDAMRLYRCYAQAGINQLNNVMSPRLFNMTEEEKQEGRINWRFRWLGLIFEFAHIEYQKGLWIDHKFPNEVGCFSEDVNQYFDDLYLDDNYEYQLRENIISIEEFKITKDFHFAFDNYLEAEKNQQIEKTDIERINDRNWISIVELANIAWHNLKKVISDKLEIEHMEGLEENYLYK